MIGEVVVDLGLADHETVEEASPPPATKDGPPASCSSSAASCATTSSRASSPSASAWTSSTSPSSTSTWAPSTSIGVQAAKRYQALPVGFTDDGALLLAMANPTNVLTIDDVGMMTGRRIRPAAASVEDLNLLLARLARMDESIEDIVDEEEEEAGERDLTSTRPTATRPIIKLVHSIVAQAVQQGASDIHVNPEEGDTKVLFRVDGVLAPAATVKRRMAMGVVSRIKIMADLDISEKRVPQDGRFALTVDGRRVDIRVVTLPLVNGEGVVMRILDQGSAVAVDGLESLGMQGAELERFSQRDQTAQRRRARHRPHRLRQVDHAVRRPARAQRRRSQHPHDRGPRRETHRRHQADADRAQGGRHLRRRAALDAARRPRRDHGRRDPRPSRRRTSPSRPRSPGTSCSRRCTRATRPARSGG